MFIISYCPTQRAMLYVILNETIFSKELVAQGEKLDRIDERLDDVNHTLTATQKNLNSVKSVFGGIKNKFFGNWVNSYGADTKSDKNAPKMTSSASSSKGFDKQKQQQEQPKAEFARITGSDREVELNKNLEDMSLGLSRLTNLAKDMSFELDRQNPIIDRIGGKVDGTNARIDSQNAQMKKILK